MSKYRKTIAILAIFAVIVSVIGATLALAQGPDAPEEPPPATTAVENGAAPPREAWRDNFDAALAAELGVTVEELAAARIAANTVVVEQAVADGHLTQEQAERILSGEWQPRARPAPGMRLQPGRPLLPQGILDREMIETAVADILGLSLADLAAARAEGQRLPDIAAAQGVELVEIETAVRTVIEEAILQAVSDGLLTQNQADRLLNWEQRRPPGRFHGQRGFRGPGGPQPPFPGNPPPDGNSSP